MNVLSNSIEQIEIRSDQIPCMLLGYVVAVFNLHIKTVIIQYYEEPVVNGTMIEWTIGAVGIVKERKC